MNYYRVYCYKSDPTIFPHAAPARVFELEGEDGKVTLGDLEPGVSWYFKFTEITQEEYMAAHAAPTQGTAVPFPRIEVYQGRDGIWRYHLRGHDGAVSLTNGEKYARKWTAKRGARRFNKTLDKKVPVVVLTTDEIIEVSSEQAKLRDAAKKATTP